MEKYTNAEVQAINDPISNDCKFALTTIDNPFNPFTQFRDWLLFDEKNNYCSSNYLARIALVSDALSVEESNQEIERAIDEIIKYDFRHIYKKAINENYKDPLLEENI